MLSRSKARSLELYSGFPHAWWRTKYLSHYLLPSICISRKLNEKLGEPGLKQCTPIWDAGFLRSNCTNEPTPSLSTNFLKSAGSSLKFCVKSQEDDY